MTDDATTSSSTISGGEGGVVLTAAAIAEAVGGRLIGDPATTVRGVAPLDRASPHGSELPRRRQVRRGVQRVARRRGARVARAGGDARAGEPRRRRPAAGGAALAAAAVSSPGRGGGRACTPRRSSGAARGSGATSRSGRTRSSAIAPRSATASSWARTAVIGEGVEVGDDCRLYPVGDGLQRIA